MEKDHENASSPAPDSVSWQSPVQNLFQGLVSDPAREVLTNLAQGHGVRIERIVSLGQASPPGFWYDQEWDEWVLVLGGHAVLAFENGETWELRSGDCITIPAHRRHRVQWTDPSAPTVWLAVHYGLPDPP